MNNLADLPGQQKRVKSLFTDLIKLQKEMEDELNLEEMYEKME